FQEKWTDELFFVLHEISMKPICLICQQTGSAFKCSNLERHHTTVHAGFSEKYLPGSNLRKNKIEQLVTSFKSQQKIIKKSSSIAECLTEASFEITWILACHKKAFTDAEIVKECFLTSAEILKNAILKQIKGLQLSDTTVMRRVEEIGKDIQQQLIADLSAAFCFSLALDESTDISDFSQLCVWIRFPQKELFCEELLCLIPMKTQTKGEDIFTALENNLEWKKLVSLCTDGAPSMRGKEKGLLGLMRKQEGIPKFIMFHCIIHQEALVSKLKNSEMQIVKQLVVKVVNFIVSRALNHRQFRVLVAEYGNLVMHNEMRWLSHGRVLERFLGLLPLIREFLESKGKGEKELEDPGWIIKPSFLTDITSHLNALNLQLQGKQKLPSNMLHVATAFLCKITTLFIPDLCSNCFVHFPKLKSVTLDNPDLLKHYQYKSFVHILEELRKEFESRFKDIMAYKELFNFIENPFLASVSSLSLVMESEILELQMDDIMKSELKAGVYHFWNIVPDLQYPTLKQCVQKVPTYTCESTFSTMNIVKRKQRNKLTNEHLDCLT
uniref:Uncharacterized protein n=1 Tax=Latimeria chalumnae TaxID=7897 RepID=H3ANB4_LATCH